MKELKEDVKPSYESLFCEAVEIETQGVLCASNEAGIATSGLDAYIGSAL